jgi:hypothetical protein
MASTLDFLHPVADAAHGVWIPGEVYGKAQTLENRPFPVKARGSSRRRGEKRPTGPMVASAFMDLPDLAPWFDNVSDGYEELPAGDHDAPYDE